MAGDSVRGHGSSGIPGPVGLFRLLPPPALVEAFGRNILEAMASGLPAILPPHFRPFFGDAAIYAEPAEVPSVVGQLYADRRAYEDVVARTETWVRARFGYEAHRLGSRSSSDRRKRLHSTNRSGHV